MKVVDGGGGKDCRGKGMMEDGYIGQFGGGSWLA